MTAFLQGFGSKALYQRRHNHCHNDAVISIKIFTMSRIESQLISVPDSVTSKKWPNVYKTCPKMISL